MMENFNLSNELLEFKNAFLKSKKYCILYLVFVLVFILTKFGFTKYNSLPFGMLIFGLVIVIGIFAITFYFKNSDEKDLYKTAFVIILLFGLLCCILMPISCAPDEYEHFVRAEITSTGQMFPGYVNNSYMTIQSYDDLVGHVRVERDQSWNTIGVENGTMFTSSTDTLPINYTPFAFGSAFAQNPFYGYLAQGFGMFVAKLFNMNAICLLWFGRMCNLILYAGMVAYAVKKTPILKVPLIAMACIPLAVYQSSSLSIDAFIDGLAIILVAYFFYMYKSPKRTIGKKEVGIFAFLCLLLGLCKISLFIFALLILFVPRDNFEDKKYYYLGILSIVLVFLLGILWTKGYADIAFHNSYRQAHWIKNGISPSGQLSFVLSHFDQTLSAIFYYFQKVDYDLIFNCRDLKFNTFNSLYLMFLGAITLLYPTERFNLKSRIGTFLVIIGLYIGTYIIFLFTWTPVGILNPLGVQPRYFLPLFPLFTFTFSFNHMKGDKTEIDSMIILLAISFLALMLIALVGTFY